jgi:hypothetical protein
MTVKEFDELEQLLRSRGIQYDADAEEFTDSAGQVLDWPDVMTAAPHLSLDDLEAYRELKERGL